MKQSYNLSIYLTLLIITMLTLSYGFVPIYRVLCQVTGYIGNIELIDYNLSLHQHYCNKVLTIYFNAYTNDIYSFIEFKPKTLKVNVISGQTILIFYHVKNHTNEIFHGISTYNIIPTIVNSYFNKIECFCFQAQLIEPFADLDLPVFFYIDPILFSDRRFLDLREITISYIFHMEQII